MACMENFFSKPLFRTQWIKAVQKCFTAWKDCEIIVRLTEAAILESDRSARPWLKKLSVLELEVKMNYMPLTDMGENCTWCNCYSTKTNTLSMTRENLYGFFELQIVHFSGDQRMVVLPSSSVIRNAVSVCPKVQNSIACWTTTGLYCLRKF